MGRPAGSKNKVEDIVAKVEVKVEAPVETKTLSGIHEGKKPKYNR